MLEIVPAHEAAAHCRAASRRSPSPGIPDGTWRCGTRPRRKRCRRSPAAASTRLHAQPLQHRQHRRGLQRRTVVAVQHRLGRSPIPRPAPCADQVGGMIGVVGACTPSRRSCGCTGPGSGRDRTTGRATLVGRNVMSQHHTWPGPWRYGWSAGAPTRAPWPGHGAASGHVAQDAGETRFAGQIDALVGEHRHDSRRRHRGEARLVGHLQHLRPLGRSQGVGRRRPAQRVDDHRYQTLAPGQRWNVRRVRPATSQARDNRAPAARRSFPGQTSAIFEAIIRPRPCGRSPRLFLRAPTTRPSPPAPCPCAAARAPAP